MLSSLTILKLKDGLHMNMYNSGSGWYLSKYIIALDKWVPLAPLEAGYTVENGGMDSLTAIHEKFKADTLTAKTQ